MRQKNGQILLEFIFSMIIVFFMIYSTIYIFQWSGLDLAGRRVAHDVGLTQDIEERDRKGPLNQIGPIPYRTKDLAATASVTP